MHPSEKIHVAEMDFTLSQVKRQIVSLACCKCNIENTGLGFKCQAKTRTQQFITGIGKLAVVAHQSPIGKSIQVTV